MLVDGQIEAAAIQRQREVYAVGIEGPYKFLHVRRDCRYFSIRWFWKTFSANDRQLFSPLR